MAKKSTSESSKRYYSSYNPEAKRMERLGRHLKKHPNDTQANSAMDNPKVRRKKPINKDGWLSRDMLQKLGFYDTNRKTAMHLDHYNPKTVAWMLSIMKKAEKRRVHETHYASKESRKKGGNAR